MVISVFLVLILVVINGVEGNHNYIGQSETIHIQNVPENMQICSPQNQPILSKIGNSCPSNLPRRISIQGCSKTKVVFILSDLRANDSGVYHLCQPIPTFTWSYFLDVQGYNVEVIANPQSSFVRNGEQVTLTCKHEVPPNIRDEVQVVWKVTNSTNVFNWRGSSAILEVNISDTRDCDMFSCELYRNDVKISHSNKRPFKINKINRSGEMPKHVLYTESTITFIIPEDVFEKGKINTFHHSSGWCLYRINIVERIVYKCTNLSYINHRSYISMKKNKAIYITLEDLSPFDSGKFKVDDLWSESLLVWGYKSFIESTPKKLVYGDNLTLTCNFLQPRNEADKFRWWKITNRERILLNHTEKIYSIGSPLTDGDQDDVYQCRPVLQIIGFSPSPRYTVKMFIPPKIKSFTINGVARNVQVNLGDLIEFDCNHISSVPVTTTYYVTHHPDRQSVPTVQLSSINATCDMDGVWTCHIDYEYGDGDRKEVLEDRKSVTLVVDNCEPKIGIADSEIKIPVKYGESTNVKIPITGTEPTVMLGRLAASGLSAEVDKRDLVINVTVADKDIFSGNLTRLDLSNQFGNDFKYIRIQPTGKPEPPSNLTVLEIAGDHVSIQWYPGFTGGSNQSFSIEHKNPSADWSILRTLPSDGDVEQTYTHTSLFDPNTLYDYRVKGINEEGESLYSNVLSVIVGTEIIERNISTPTVENMSQGDNNVLTICLTVGVIAILTFTTVMVLIFIKLRKNTGERVDEIHRESSETEPEDGGIYDQSLNASSSSSPGLSAQAMMGSDPTIGSTDIPYPQRPGATRSDTNSLPRFSSDQRSPHVQFQS